MKLFRLNDTWFIACDSVKTRYGFRHDATLLRNGVEVDTDKCCYYNRTWESFQYETVLYDLLDKTSYLSTKEKK